LLAIESILPRARLDSLHPPPFLELPGLFIFFHGNKFLIKHSASMSSQKKVRGLMKEGPLVQMLDRQRVQQAAADEAKKLVDAAALASERLVDATKEAEETATAAAAAAAAAALSAPEEAQVTV
jgi:hypothetical protein